MNHILILLLSLAFAFNLNGEEEFDSFDSSVFIHEDFPPSLLESDYECGISHRKNEDKDKHLDSVMDSFEPILSAECEPLAAVAGCVNVISGHFFQINKDFENHSVEPLSIIRYYDSGNTSESFLGYGFGSQFPLWASTIEKGARHHYALISERECFLIPYKGKIDSHHRKVCKIDPRLMEKGYTNLSRTVTSGHANFINWKATFESSDHSDGKWSVQLGDGTLRIYAKYVKIKLDHMRRLNLPAKEAYLLTKEIKPNGNQVLYSYKLLHEKYRLSKIEMKNREGNLTLNEINFSYSPESRTATDLYGNQVEYTVEEMPCLNHHVASGKDQERKVLKKVKSLQKGELTYETKKEKGYRKIVRVEKPQGRFLEVQYQEATHYKEEDRVTCILEPRGKNDKVIKTYQFDYHENYTKVLDALDFPTLYHFDHNQRLTRIDYLNHHGKPLRQEAFEWSKKEGEEGWLRSKAIQLDDQIFYLKTYRYDSDGNIAQMTTCGNLTGEKSETFTSDQSKGMDQYAIQYTYSDDGRNLLKTKTTPEGLKISYDYLPGTNLCTKALEFYHGRIQERTFYTYDSTGQIIKVIEDNGSGEDESNLTDVTFRKIKIIETYQTPYLASFGKPFQENEFYQNASTGEIFPLKRKEFFYDTKGRETKQKVYTQEGFCYETTQEYNDRDQLISKTNPLGYTTYYQWDENNNKEKETVFELTEQGPKELKSISFEYDLANRLKKKIEKHNHEEIFETSYSYNAMGQLISEVDHNGNETNYVYDRFGNQKEWIKPERQDSQGTWIRPTIKKQYNALGQTIREINENGFETTYAYNLYGSPTQILYPNGSIQRFTYYPSGWLKKKWNPDGTAIEYAYDPKGRLTKEIFLDRKGQSIKEEEYFYAGALLRHKKDGMNLLTTYFYDAAGRKIEEKVGELKSIRYAYDDLGRVVKIEKNGQQEIYEYDWLDRVTSKTQQDQLGHLYAKETYQFNLEGKQIEKKVWLSHDQIAVYRSHYHSDDSLAWKENPLKSLYQWHYNYHRKEEGKQVLEKKILDPLSRPILEIYNPHHQISKQETFDLNGRQLSCKRFDYDASGNCVKEHVSILAEGQLIREYWIERQYNSRGLIEKEIEMPSGKATQYTYDVMDRLSQKIKPDGIILMYSYDPLGRMHTKASSDGSISYTYLYDLHDNIIEVHDHIHYFIQRRFFDLYGRLIREEMSPGIFIYYDYDALDRLTRMILPDGSFVHYFYDAYHLKKMQRFLPGTFLYEVECAEYDLKGHLLAIRLPAGVIHYTYDLLGRTIRVNSPFWESHLEHFDAIGNLLKIRQKDPNGIVEGQFVYDRFNHLCTELFHEANQYSYDSLGNCLTKNHKNQHINDLNQLIHDGESAYSYDLNGNLKTESPSQTLYTYDALNRLISCEKEGQRTTFFYDAFGRCLQIANASGIKHLLYQGDQEIGSLMNGQLQEFRLIHPNARYDLTLAIELQGQAFFPIQDFRGNICALQRLDGSVAEWYRYSAFGSKTIASNLQGIFNPWRFANRREVANLSLFTHRFYNPHLMRWQTTDPLGFEDGLNLYAYVHNNPFCYKDLDGRFAFVLPLVFGAFGTGGLVLSTPTIGAIAGITVGTALGWGAYKALRWADNTYNQVQIDQDKSEVEENRGRKKGKDNEIKGGPPRDRYTGDYLPDPLAEGTPHTTLGNREGRRVGSYAQGATFDEKGEFRGRTDVTDHGRHDHANPHYHPATGSNSVDSQSITIPEFFW